MSKKYSNEEIHEFANTLSMDAKEKLVGGCRKKLIKCNLEAWHECVHHGRYWDYTLDGCTRPYQDALETRGSTTEVSPT